MKVYVADGWENREGGGEGGSSTLSPSSLGGLNWHIQDAHSAQRLEICTVKITDGSRQKKLLRSVEPDLCQHKRCVTSDSEKASLFLNKWRFRTKQRSSRKPSRSTD